MFGHEAGQDENFSKVAGKLESFIRLDDYAKSPYARRVEYGHGRRKITATN